MVLGLPLYLTCVLVFNDPLLQSPINTESHDYINRRLTGRPICLLERSVFCRRGNSLFSREASSASVECRPRPRRGREARGPLPASGAKPPSVALMPAAAFAVSQREQKCPASLVSSFSENPRLWHLVKCAFGKHSELGALTSTPGNTLRRLVLSGSSEVAVGRTGMCSLRPLASAPGAAASPRGLGFGPAQKAGARDRCGLLAWSRPLTHRGPGQIMSFLRPLNFNRNRKSGWRTPEAPPSSQSLILFPSHHCCFYRLGIN